MVHPGTSLRRSNVLRDEKESRVKKGSYEEEETSEACPVKNKRSDVLYVRKSALESNTVEK